jgi:HK97 family phage major capsid protein
MSIQALRERKTAVAKEANAILAEKGSQVWSSEDKIKYDALMDELERVNSQIKAYEKQLDLDADNIVNDAERARSSGARSRGGEDGEISLLDAVALYLRMSANDMTPAQALAVRNAMSTTTPSEGGYTTPSTVATMVIDALKEFGGMRDVATVLPTERGEALSYPTSDGTTETGEWLGENAPATQGDITFGSVPLNVFLASSKKIALPWALIQDSAIDVVAFVINRLAQRLGRLTSTGYTIGDGAGKPWGIVTRATAGKVAATGNVSTFIYDDLLALVHSVNRAYRRQASFSMSDTALMAVRKIKDTDGRPIFVPSYEFGITQDAPDMLLGKPININDDIPVPAANAKSILFGDHKQYVIRDAMGFLLRRFDDSAFALNGQVGFCGWMRTGGNLLDTAAVKYLQNSAT